MKEYLLLRTNEQSGPYSIAALQQLPLRPADLVWVEGESERWEPVTERPELIGFVVAEPRRDLPQTTRASVPEPEPVVLVAPEIAVRTETARPFRFESGSRQAAGGLWIGALFLCLVGGAVVVKKVIENGQALAQTSAAALSTEPLPGASNDEEGSGIAYRNALKTETVRKEHKPDAADLRLHDLRKLVHVVTNTSKEGLFEGINDLQIRIQNTSVYTLSQVNIEVSYRERGATQWHKEIYSVNGVQPKSNKILVVPPVERGARVKYRLVGVESVATPTHTPA
ncbi:MAG: DUF4339 domain-containing protein [Chitinophagaceae bacterium]|nr:MAG: DUF4339 domain-containing protein [Chitinophagaceae bacterium]